MTDGVCSMKFSRNACSEIGHKAGALKSPYAPVRCPVTIKKVSSGGHPACSLESSRFLRIVPTRRRPRPRASPVRVGLSDND